MTYEKSTFSRRKGLNSAKFRLKERKEEYQNLLSKLEESEETQISLTDPDSRAMMNNQRIEVCYNVQTTVDEKHKLILDYDVTNECEDYNQLSKMAKRAKNILGTDSLNVLSDRGYFDLLEIKECIDNGIVPYIPEPSTTVPKRTIPKPMFYKDKFVYDNEKDVYICPAGCEMPPKNTTIHRGKKLKLYKTNKCLGCGFKNKCTKNPKGKIIYRWEHEEILEGMRERVKNNKDLVKKRQELSEHPFGTIKRAFGQGYMLMKRLRKVSGEMALTMLAYDITRVINIVGVNTLIARV